MRPFVLLLGQFQASCVNALVQDSLQFQEKKFLKIKTQISCKELRNATLYSKLAWAITSWYPICS